MIDLKSGELRWCLDFRDIDSPVVVLLTNAYGSKMSSTVGYVKQMIKEACDREKIDGLVESVAFAMEQLSEALSATAISDKVPKGIQEKALQKCVEQLADSHDSKYGGFGSAQKFPSPVEIQLMLYHSKKLNENGMSGESKDLMMVVLTSQCHGNERLVLWACLYAGAVPSITYCKDVSIRLGDYNCWGILI